jgi:hypothetical protein
VYIYSLAVLLSSVVLLLLFNGNSLNFGVCVSFHYRFLYSSQHKHTVIVLWLWYC